ncbi:MAG: CarboxypepD reg-like domain [Acidobacteriota bacterium]|jgi:hypothetical protein|nr:CarboxypepD reg-like domain [Acidobacteriota bacterium]
MSFLGALLLAAFATPPLATLCVAEAPCVEVATSTPLPAAGGPFLRRSADGQTARIGVLPLTGETRQIEFVVPVTRDLPPRLHVEVKSTKSWSWTAQVEAPESKFRIELPKSEKPEIMITADGFDPFTVTEETKTVRLKPQPLLSGRVLDGATNKPLPGATIALPDGKSLTTTSGDGAFRARVPGEWPEHVTFSLRGRGTRVVVLPRQREDTALPEVTLRAASSIDLIVDNRDALPSKLSWQAVLRHNGPNTEVLQRGELAAISKRIHIEDLAEGSVIISLSGPKPMQRFGVLFELRDGDTAEQHVTITPSLLIARVLLGEKPVPNAKLSLFSWNARWEAIVNTEDDGTYRDELWETGSFAIAASSKEFPNVYVENRELAPAAEIKLDFIIPDHRVIAEVVDGSGKPVPHARVTCEQFINGRKQPVGGGYTDNDGRITFGPARVGRSIIRVLKEGIAEPTPLTFEIIESEREKTVRIVLNDGEARTLTVVDTRNSPVAGASVIVAAINGVLPLGVTGVDGTLRIGLADPRRGTLFVVPRGGGFGFLRLATVDGEEPKIVIPDTGATLKVTTLDNEGAPIPNVTFLFQWNGMLLPLEVQQEIERVQGVAFRTNADGIAWLPNLPPGYVELWPLTSRAELDRILSLAPPDAAARIQVNRGQQSVVMKFRPVAVSRATP